MEKSARKRSNDPVQEHLRENKAKWNEDVSTLISRLISLKRVMNGKADEAFGTPPSNIKDPLPPQIASGISTLQAGSGEVFNKARAIIDEQAQYSAHRQKSHKSASLEDLVKEASWFGSRLVSRFSRLELAKEERALRNRLINSAVEQWDLLLELEEFVGLYRNEEDVSRIFSKTNSMLISYESMLKRFSKLYNLKLDLDKKKDSDIAEEIPVEEIKPEANLEENEESKDPVKDSESFESPDVVDPNLIKKFNNIRANGEEVRKMLQILVDDADLDAEEKKWFRDARSKFSKALGFLTQKIEGMTADSALDTIEKISVFLLFVDEILKRIAIQKEFLGTDFTPIEVKAFLKEAGPLSPIKRWVGKNILKLKTQDYAPMRLDVIEASNELRKSFNQLLNTLEKKFSTAEEMLNDINKTREKWLELGNYIILLGQKYHSEERRQERGKEFYKKDINTTDFANLLSALRKIKNYVP